MRGCRGKLAAADRGDVEVAVLDNCLERRRASLLLADEKDMMIDGVFYLGITKLDTTYKTTGRKGGKKQARMKKRCSRQLSFPLRRAQPKSLV